MAHLSEHKPQLAKPDTPHDASAKRGGRQPKLTYDPDSLAGRLQLRCLLAKQRPKPDPLTPGDLAELEKFGL